MAQTGKPAGYTERRCAALEYIVAKDGIADFSAVNLRTANEIFRMGLIAFAARTGEEMVAAGLMTREAVEADYAAAGTRDLIWMSPTMSVTDKGRLTLGQWRLWSGKTVH